MEPKITVVFVSARPDSLKILCDSMSAQTFQDYEVICVMPERLNPGEIANYSPQRWTFFNDPPKVQGDFWALSKCLNLACRQARGELIVLVQDYIRIPADGLQRYWDRYQQEPRSLVSGVSDQFDSITGEKTFSDPRKQIGSHGGERYRGFFLTIPLHWEANWGSFPRQAWLYIGGFDEAFDAGWGYDNVNFAERAQLAGYHIFLDTDNEVHAIDHQRLFGESDFKAKAPNNQKLWAMRYSEISQGIRSWKIAS